MATHKLAILGHRHVALYDAGTHFHGCDVGLFGVLGELHAGATVPCPSDLSQCH